MKIIKKNSPNFDERRDGPPSMIILHYTGTLTAQEAEDIYLMPQKVAPHYMIDGKGDVIQYVEEDKRAWHAGQSSWGRLEDINSASIGIEVWNTGHEHNLEDFLECQIETLIELVSGIKDRNDISDDMILGHSDIAPGRKIDPGEKFPWGRLAAAGIGLMPSVTEEDERLASHWMDEPQMIVTGLKEYGYNTQLDIDLIMREFRRHFLPGTIDTWGADMEMCSTLAALLRQKRKLKFMREHRLKA